MTSNEIAKDALAIKQLCYFLISNKKTEHIHEIHSIITKNELATAQLVQMVKIDLLGIFVLIVRNSDDYRINEDIKIILLKIVSTTLSHNKLNQNEILLFHNIFGSLIQEVYYVETSTLKNVSEELMFEVLNSIKLLFGAITEKLCLLMYTKENAMRLCKSIYIDTEVLKHKSRKLKAVAIECLMSMFRVKSKGEIDHLLYNITIAQTIADCYSYFLPGIALALGGVVFEGSIVGEHILELTIEAMGKIMAILLKDYDEKNNSLEDAKSIIISRLNSSTEVQNEQSINKKDALLQMKRTWKWFQTSDKNLALIFEKFTYLTNHSTFKVRSRLADMCVTLIKHCFKNIPQSAHRLIEMLILMSDNNDKKITHQSRELFEHPILGERIKNIVSEDFPTTFSRIPTIFNGIGTVHQVNILKLTTISLKIVGSKIKCGSSFKEFQRTLLYLCEVEIGASNIVEVVCHEGFDSGQGEYTNAVDLWKNFKFMKEKDVRIQFGELCKTIYQIDLFPVLSDYLIDIITFGEEKIEAFYLMNQLLYGINKGEFLREEGHIQLVMPTFETYINNWEVPLEIYPYSDECNTVKALKTNILQAALLCEGVGLMASHAIGEEHLRPFLFNSMYKILIRAASPHYTIRSAAVKALEDMSTGLGYSGIKEMLTENMDFCLFFVERGLKKSTQNREVFEVMEAVMKYGDVSLVDRFADWVNEVLIQSFDRFKQDRIDLYLRMFRVFFRRLIRSYNVAEPPEDRVFQTLQQKKESVEIVKVTGADEEIVDFSDESVDHSAWDMYQEDEQKRNSEDDSWPPQDEPYCKTKPPKPIELTVEILKRSLHFLPSRDTERQIMVLEILTKGLEIIRQHEDEVLPVIHLIWSPLVERFKNADSPVVFNLSFKLLLTMARISKDFIRNRTAKDVLPNLLSNLTTLWKNNHIETCKHSVDYKLQFTILGNMFSMIYDIEFLEEDIDAILKVVVLYTDENQPGGLRAAAYEFFRKLTSYNPAYHEQLVNVFAEDLTPKKDEKCQDVEDDPLENFR